MLFSFSRHAGLSPEQIKAVGQQVETVLHVPRLIIKETSKGTDRKKDGKFGASYGTGEERIYQIRQALEELGKVLRKLPDLALRINAVTGIHPAFRFTEVRVLRCMALILKIL